MERAMRSVGLTIVNKNNALIGRKIADGSR